MNTSWLPTLTPVSELTTDWLKKKNKKKTTLQVREIEKEKKEKENLDTREWSNVFASEHQPFEMSELVEYSLHGHDSTPLTVDSCVCGGGPWNLSTSRWDGAFTDPAETAGRGRTCTHARTHAPVTSQSKVATKREIDVSFTFCFHLFALFFIRMNEYICIYE